MYIGPPDDDDGNGGTDGSGEDCSSFSHEPKRSQYQEGNKRPEIVEMAAGSADVLSQSRALSSTGFVVAVDKDGGVWSWGEGRFGQLGHGDVEERLYPTRVEALRGVGIRWSAAGGRHSALVSEAGVVWTAGAGREGQLGHGGVSLQSSSTFQRVDDLLCGRAVTRVCVCVCVCGGGAGRGDWGGFCNPPPPHTHKHARAHTHTHTRRLQREFPTLLLSQMQDTFSRGVVGHTESRGYLEPAYLDWRPLLRTLAGGGKFHQLLLFPLPPPAGVHPAVWRWWREGAISVESARWWGVRGCCGGLLVCHAGGLGCWGGGNGLQKLRAAL